MTIGYQGHNIEPVKSSEIIGAIQRVVIDSPGVRITTIAARLSRRFESDRVTTIVRAMAKAQVLTITAGNDGIDRVWLGGSK